MSAITIPIILIYYLISIIYIICLFGKYKVCPELLWAICQLVMFFGITHFIDANRHSDRLLLVLYLIALICFIVCNSLLHCFRSSQRMFLTNSRPDLFDNRKPFIWLILIVSIILCTIFFSKGGGNVFINGLRSLISGTDYSTKYSRMGLLSVSGVGYIYQLRVIVFPLMVLYYVSIKRIKPLSIILSIVMLLFLVGTGQRGGLFSFFAIVLVFLYYFIGNKKEQKSNVTFLKRLRIIIIVVGITGALFVLSTILNGRVASGGTVFTSVLQRFFEDNQSCAVWGFRYIYNEPIQNGRDWMLQLIDILPGQNSYMSLDTRIFAYINGGSTAGTAPACIWGSAYYNFGIFGVILLSGILAMLVGKIHLTYANRVNDEWNTIAYSAEQFLLAYWVAAGPIVLFNNGFIAVIILNVIMNFSLKFRFVLGRKKIN